MVQFDYFLSYSRVKYTESIESLLLKLHKIGLIIWVDQFDTYPGLNARQNLMKILHQVKQSTGAIILLDKTYLTKPWCQWEFSYFLQNKVSVLPILYHLNRSLDSQSDNKFNQLTYYNLQDSETSVDTCFEQICLHYINSLKFRKFKSSSALRFLVLLPINSMRDKNKIKRLIVQIHLLELLNFHHFNHQVSVLLQIVLTLKRKNKHNALTLQDIKILEEIQNLFINLTD